ncbi:MAG: ankyrin repeat domain-containing protein [Anaerolineaceae bacterium]|nr:ankyrin repeat domain-containing protein [Anaerolineaceae bacterium]
MGQDVLFTAVSTLAEATHTFSDADMAQPFHWRKHGEGVRLGLIGTHHELQDLAATLAAERSQSGPPTPLVQQVLGQVHTAYRELQAALLGITDAEFDQEPAAGEWPLRIILGHIFTAERTFFTLIISGLAQQRAGAARPFTFPDDEVERVNGSQDAFYDLIDNQPLAAILQHYNEFHQRVRTELADLTDEQFLGPSPIWWEKEEYSLQYRLHRFEAHLRQHLVQIEKTLLLLNRPETEASRFLRLIFRALSGVENAVLGASELGLAERQTLATIIHERTAVLQQVVSDGRRLETAVNNNDHETIKQITAANPALAGAIGQNSLPLLMNAVYQRKTAVVDALLAAGTKPDVFAAAALGDLVRLQFLAGEWPGYLNLFARDGFTPLQLACYFNQETAALWLIEQGADVNAVAKNKMKIAPIHATATHGNLAILRALLEKGADVNAAQEGGYTAVHQAAHRNNVPMAQLLLEFGADPHQPDANDQTALQLAQAEGNEAVAAVLGGQ